MDTWPQGWGWGQGHEGSQPLMQQDLATAPAAGGLGLCTPIPEASEPLRSCPQWGGRLAIPREGARVETVAGVILTPAPVGSAQNHHPGTPGASGRPVLPPLRAGMLGWASDTRTQGASVWKPKGQPGVQGESAPGPALSPSASLCAVRPGSSLRTPGCLQVTRVFPLTLLSLVKRGRRSLTQTRGTWGFVALRAKGKHEARDAGSLLQAGFPAAVGSPYSANARTPRMYVTHSHLYTYTRMHTPPAHKHACVHTRVHSVHHPHTQTTHPHTSTHIHLCTAHCHIHAVTHGHTSMSTGTHSCSSPRGAGQLSRMLKTRWRPALPSRWVWSWGWEALHSCHLLWKETQPPGNHLPSLSEVTAAQRSFVWSNPTQTEQKTRMTLVRRGECPSNAVTPRPRRGQPSEGGWGPRSTAAPAVLGRGGVGSRALNTHRPPPLGVADLW